MGRAICHFMLAAERYLSVSYWLYTRRCALLPRACEWLVASNTGGGRTGIVKYECHVVNMFSLIVLKPLRLGLGISMLDVPQGPSWSVNGPTELTEQLSVPPPLRSPISA